MHFSLKLILTIFLLKNINIIACKESPKEKVPTDELYQYIKWAKYNNLSLYPSLNFTKETKNTKTSYKLYTNETIPVNTTLMTIPPNLLLNITKILDLIKSEEIKKQYELFMDNDIYEDDYSPEFKKDEAFLSYIFYQIHEGRKKITKTLFYKKYKHFINSVKINPEFRPLFFDNVGMNKLYLSYINTLYTINKKNFELETYIFKSDSYYKRDIDYDEYIPIRIAIINTGLALNEQKILATELNIINSDYLKYNSNYIVESDGSIRIYSTKEKKQIEEIIFFFERNVQC